MTAELATYEPAQDVERYQDVAVQRLGEWARSAQAAHQVATRLVQTSFVPAQFRDKAGEATAAILAGLEVGLQPMASLRSFDIISGVAAPRAATLRAVVQSHGHELLLIESTDTRCRMRGRRRGSQDWQTVQWTIDRAKALGLTGKDNWKKQPAAMLVARATSELARLVAADAILGIAYSSEEIIDGAAPDDTPPQPEPNGSRRMSRVRPAAETPPPDAPEPINEGQRKRMFALYHDLGIEDRAERLADTSAFLGVDVASSNDLTASDAARLISHLEMRADGPPPDEPVPSKPGG